MNDPDLATTIGPVKPLWLILGGALATTVASTGPLPASGGDSGSPLVMNHAAHDRLDAELRAIVDDPAEPLASLSVVAVRDGAVVYHRQFGFRRIDGDDPRRSLPADGDTLYRIASISKLITSIGVMRLVEDGLLDLDADVSAYLGFQLRNPHFPEVPITLRMLMSHTSSLRDNGGYYWDYSTGLALRDALVPGGRAFGQGRMWAADAPPGAYFHYANLPWGVIGAAMERVTGERFDRLMRRLVLDPLNLSGGFSPADLPPEQVRNIATLYRKRPAGDDEAGWNPAGRWIAQTDDFGDRPPAPRAGDDYVPGANGTLFGPQGNCRLSADGLGRVMRMLMNGGELDGRRVLSAESVDLMLAEQWRFDGRNGNAGGEFTNADVAAMNAWGLGVQRFLDISRGQGKGDRLVEPGGFAAVGHMGDAYGLTSAMVFDRERKIGLIFLVGGVGFDPTKTPGKYSAMRRYEERILTALYRRAVLNDAE